MVAEHKTNDAPAITWQEYNLQVLLFELNQLQEILHNHLADKEKIKPLTSLQPTVVINSEDFPPTLIDTLCMNFSLNTFERKIVLLCLGIELISDFPLLCAQIHEEPQASYPTLGLLLTLFPKEGYWQALSPQAPLRYWSIIEVEQGPSFVTQRLRINEKILHFILGNNAIDERLLFLLKLIQQPSYSIESYQSIANKLYSLLQRLDEQKPPCLHLTATDINNARSIAAYLSQKTNILIYSLNTSLLPTEMCDLIKIQRLLEMEIRLHQFIYLVEYDASTAEKSTIKIFLNNLAQRLPTYCLFTSSELPACFEVPVINIDVKPPAKQEQRLIWQTLLKPSALTNPSLDQLNTHFNLNLLQIENIASIANSQLNTEEVAINDYLWQQSRQHARRKINNLIQLIEPNATWQDIVLADTSMQLLKTIAAQVKQRHKVYQDWGFAEKSARGLNICALFAGVSGTGKTLAAEILARELNLDLYHIDLSMVVSKYIGETEKNIKTIFDQAEASGALLLFDEADALFGKRSEVRDSHDRYANIEVSYLLQRIEAYQGLSILTTNLKNAIDEAFLRRIRFIVSFQFPDVEQRKLIWQRVFPAKTPLAELDFSKLARLNITGGHIRNIALNAAFHAAENNEKVSMQHILQATQSEYLKLEKTLSNVEIKDWI